jgi:hypothetical protein
MNYFLLRFFSISALLVLASFFAMGHYFEALSSAIIMLPVLVVGSFTLISYLILVKTFTQAPIKFIRKFMVITTLRILGYLIFILGFVVLNPAIAKPFLIHFLIIYIIYLVYEVIELSSKRSLKGN